MARLDQERAERIKRSEDLPGVGMFTDQEKKEKEKADEAEWREKQNKKIRDKKIRDKKKADQWLNEQLTAW